MVYLHENIRYLRKQRKLTQSQLADQLGIKRSVIGAYEEGRAAPKLTVIQQIALFFEVSIDELISINIEVTPPKKKEKKANLRILTTVVDSNNEERISIIPNKASAGYLNGLADPEYVAELPHFALPVKELSHGKTYRVFQIKGDSMLPIPPGSYVFCDYVESFDGIRDGKPYIIITANDGIVYKRVFNNVFTDGKLLLKSDNKEYEPYSIEANEVLEVWQALGFLTFDLPEPMNVDINHLSSMVMEMKEEMKNLKKLQ